MFEPTLKILTLIIQLISTGFSSYLHSTVPTFKQRSLLVQVRNYKDTLVMALESVHMLFNNQDQDYRNQRILINKLGFIVLFESLNARQLIRKRKQFE